MWVRIPLEKYIFILNFSLPPSSEQVNEAVANEIKHVHSPEFIVVLDPRYDLSYKALYINNCSIALINESKIYARVHVTMSSLALFLVITMAGKCRLQKGSVKAVRNKKKISQRRQLSQICSWIYQWCDAVCIMRRYYCLNRDLIGENAFNPVLCFSAIRKFVN